MDSYETKGVCCLSSDDTKYIGEEILFNSFNGSTILRIITGLILLGLYTTEFVFFALDMVPLYNSYVHRPKYETIIISSKSESDDEYKTIVTEGKNKDCGKYNNSELIVDFVNSELFGKIMSYFLIHYIIIIFFGALMDIVMKFCPRKGKNYHEKILTAILSYYLPLIKMMTSIIIGPIINCSYDDCIDGPIYLYAKSTLYLYFVLYGVISSFAYYILFKKIKNKMHWSYIILIFNVPGIILGLVLYAISFLFHS